MSCTCQKHGTSTLRLLRGTRHSPRLPPSPTAPGCLPFNIAWAPGPASWRPCSPRSPRSSVPALAGLRTRDYRGLFHRARGFLVRSSRHPHLLHRAPGQRSLPRHSGRGPQRLRTGAPGRLQALAWASARQRCWPSPSPPPPVRRPSVPIPPEPACRASRSRPDSAGLRDLIRHHRHHRRQRNPRGHFAALAIVRFRYLHLDRGHRQQYPGGQRAAVRQRPRRQTLHPRTRRRWSSSPPSPSTPSVATPLSHGTSRCLPASPAPRLLFISSAPRPRCSAPTLPGPECSQEDPPQHTRRSLHALR